MKDLEHFEQSRFFGVIRTLKHPGLKGIFAVPNGFLRTPSMRIRAWQEGQLSGVWDVLLPTPCGGHHGLWLEFKSPRGKLTEAQQTFGALMSKRGYQCAVVRSYKEALEVVEKYLRPFPFEPEAQ